VAKKLDIDCAPAMVGWEFTNGFMRPVYEGFVICKEAAEFIMDAWNQDVEEQAKNLAAKKEKRAIYNWSKLVRGMLLYKKIANKYGNMVNYHCNTVYLLFGFSCDWF
jgi:xeroderma pigmentosum group C-complementing protein